MEGASWLGSKIIIECDKLEDRINHLIKEYEEREEIDAQNAARYGEMTSSRNRIWLLVPCV